MVSAAKTVEDYLAELEPDRRESVSAIRQFILASIPEGYTEGMGYGMIYYSVPHSIYPAGYHCDPKQPVGFLGLASQKSAITIYLMCLWGNPELKNQFLEACEKNATKVNLKGSCLKFKKASDAPLKELQLIFEKMPVAAYLAWYEAEVIRSKVARLEAKKAAKA